MKTHHVSAYTTATLMVFLAVGCCTPKVAPPPSSPAIGTVLPSMLEWSRFAETVGDPMPFDQKVNKWAPCDSREITGSSLEKLTGLAFAPDLRGVFLRGLNSFSPEDEPSKVPDNQADPTNRVVGTFQSDDFKSHSHPAKGKINGSVSGSNGTHDVDGGGDKWNSDPNFGDHNVVVTIDPTGGAETRPKNVAVFYYIRINP
jgi:hypothetical protein